MNKRFEAGLDVRISGLRTEKQANELNEAIANLLIALADMPCFEGDLVASGQVIRYDADDPDADGTVV